MAEKYSDEYWEDYLYNNTPKGSKYWSRLNDLSTEELSSLYNYMKNNYQYNAYGKKYKSFDDFWNALSTTYNYTDVTPVTPSAENIQRTQDIANATQTAGTTRTAAQNAGINRTKAGLLGSAGANSAATNDTVSGVQSNISNATSTQNDWLAQQGYITGLENQAENYRKGMALNAGSAFLGGFGSGLQLGGHI